MPRLLQSDEITRQLTDIPPWHYTDALHAEYVFAGFAEALEFVNHVGSLAEEMNHHPDIDIRWNKVELTLTTHSEGGVTQYDIELAHRIAHG